MSSKIFIHNQDCLPAMRAMKDNDFDLAIVDPPYGIGQVWSKSRKARFFRVKSEYKNDKVPTREYFKQLRRVSKNQIIFGWNYFAHKLPRTNNIIVWDKERDFRTTFMSECEFAWHSFTHPARIVTFAWNGAIKGSENGKTTNIHPYQKPVDLYRWLLKEYAKPGQRVLDTHLGSGSSAVACYDMGVDLVGYEKNKDFFYASNKRIENHKRQLKFI